MKMSRALPFLALVASCVAQQTGPCAFSTVLVAGGAPIKCYIPWLVSLRNSHYQNSHYCAGSLISENIVLTAAHCLFGGLQYVYIGGVNRYWWWTGDGSGYDIREVEHTAVHPEYDSKWFLNDIALLYLSEPSHKEVAPLAISTSCFTNAEGCEVEMVGWGYTDSSNELPYYLMGAKSRSMSDVECALYHTGSSFNPQTEICVKPGMIQICPGDSGGPLIVKGKVAGIASHGSARSGDHLCPDPDDNPSTRRPTVFTSVPGFHDWIFSNMNKLDLLYGPDSYSDDMVV